jgi:hypothetical protein
MPIKEAILTFVDKTRMFNPVGQNTIGVCSSWEKKAENDIQLTHFSGAFVCLM